mgnify:CR=1 FL=1|tara:strand:+ start:114 stop:665 length:552 start_codon:yes stop_codon:yes gene_type:complete
MHQKNKLRKKYLNLRKKKYQEINNKIFLPLFKLIKLRLKKNLFKIALYYPSNFELNVLKIFQFKSILAQDTLLPAIEKNNLMEFFPWKKNEVLNINEFGIPEPLKSKAKIPDVMLIPTLAFDENKFRLGYGKGYYDRYLNKYLKKYKDILTVGVAFSFQKYHKLPINQKDVKLNFILTEKGIY